MAEDIKVKPVTLADIQQPSKPAPDTAAQKKGEVGQQEFLQMLVHQLQNQDPLNPLSSEDFAVQLAQFSQLEQLVDINKKLGKTPDENAADGSAPVLDTSVSSMASFLGNEVVLKDSTVEMSSGVGPNALLNFPPGVQSARIDYLGPDGKVVGSKEIESPAAGRNVISLDNESVADGNYNIRAVAVNGDGKFVNLESKITGTVEGFIVEPEPALIVNGEQVAMGDIQEVHLGKE